MPEATVIQYTPTPLTVAALADKLRACGMASGQTVLVHTAMSKLGWVSGGPQAVIMALIAVLGDSGTLMMPTHTGSNTDPQGWQNPPVPESWWPVIRAHRPAYDPATSPTRQMGAVAELFRTWPGTIRSAHPVVSFAARGPHAAALTADHPLTGELGDQSPLGRLYDLDGYVLLLGVGHGNNTSLHLAEFRADFPGKKTLPNGCAMLVDGQRQWVQYDSLDINDGDFVTIGQAFDVAHAIPVQQITQAEVRFFKQRAVVDFAVTWMEQNRNF
ncbi:MAG: AAC(3) family N-acetyltransferase [Anaerolineae bacterium]|nr:AAC(3) family N-acetyltransferase [Anaerolineae bacterium]